MSDRKLQAHMRLEHEAGGNEPGAKNYVCDWCNYAGATQVHLTNHVKSVHENVRRHHCDQCDFTSYATTALKRHVAAVHERKFSSILSSKKIPGFNLLIYILYISII